MKTQLRKQTNLHKQVKQLTVCALALGTVVGAILPTMVEAKSPEQEIGEHFSSLATHVKDDSVELWLYKGFVLTAELTKDYMRQQKGLEVSFEEVEDNLVSEPINISPVARVAEFVGVEESPEVLAPVIKEPVYEAPVVVEPVVDESVSEEPVVVEPIVEAPIVEESVVEDEPVNISPIIRVEDLEWSNDGSQEEPIVGTPVVEESVIEAPVVEEPIVELPVIEESVVEVPVVEESVIEAPVVEESVIEAPVVEESIVELPVIEESVVEAPLTGGVQMRVQATMYSQHQEGLSNWTAGGYNLNENPNIIAVNPSVIPYGSVVVIEGVGTYIAGDTGSYTTWGGDYTTGIDIHTNDLATAYEFGKKFVNITVYPAGTDVASHGRVSPVVEESTLAEEPVIEEPVYVEPVIEEPVYVEPVVEEPAYVEPVIEESVIEEPVVEEPVYVEPVIEEPVLELPVTDEPVYVEPVIEEPVIEEPVIEEPVIEEPVYVEPVIEEPVYVEPVIEEPVYEEPVYEEPVYEEPVYNGGDIIANAEKYIGTPYEWGGKTPDGFDCSGFVQYVYEETYGVNLGGWTGEQQYSGSVIGVDEAQVGDLYFWGQYGGDTSHVAIAAGGGNYIHASQPGTDLGYSHTDWYTPDFAVSPNL